MEPSKVELFWIPLLGITFAISVISLTCFYLYWRHTACYDCDLVEQVEVEAALSPLETEESLAYAENAPIKVSLRTETVKYAINKFIVSLATESLNASIPITGAVHVELAHLSGESKPPSLLGLCDSDMRIDGKLAMPETEAPTRNFSYYFFVAEIVFNKEELEISPVLFEGPFRLGSDGAFLAQPISDSKLMAIVSSGKTISVETCSGESKLSASWLPSVLMLLYDSEARCIKLARKVGEGWVKALSIRALGEEFVEVQLKATPNLRFRTPNGKVEIPFRQEDPITLLIATGEG